MNKPSCAACLLELTAHSAESDRTRPAMQSDSRYSCWGRCDKHKQKTKKKKKANSQLGLIWENMQRIDIVYTTNSVLRRRNPARLPGAITAILELERTLSCSENKQKIECETENKMSCILNLANSQLLKICQKRKLSKGVVSVSGEAEAPSKNA